MAVPAAARSVVVVDDDRSASWQTKIRHWGSVIIGRRCDDHLEAADELLAAGPPAESSSQSSSSSSPTSPAPTASALSPSLPPLASPGRGLPKKTCRRWPRTENHNRQFQLSANAAHAATSLQQGRCALTQLLWKPLNARRSAGHADCTRAATGSPGQEGVSLGPRTNLRSPSTPTAALPSPAASLSATRAAVAATASALAPWK